MLPNRFSADATLGMLVQYAYGVQPYQIFGGPQWVRSARFQIEAIAPGHPTRDQMFLMLQALLEERFQLKIHRDSRPLPLYILKAAKGGLKLPAPRPGACEPAPDSTGEWAGGRMAAPGSAEATTSAVVVPQCGRASIALGQHGAQLDGASLSMPELARELSRILDRRVIDRTGYAGHFDMQLDFVPGALTEAVPPPPPGANISGQSITNALREQYGIQLDPAKGPVDVVAIDAAGVPTAN
jgi:uncharacterized protein (TIGR03435 family)